MKSKILASPTRLVRESSHHTGQYEQERALKKALVLYHWISAPTKEIEEAHHLFFGAPRR
jgi:hypothetical protein